MDQATTKPTHVRYRVTGFALSLAFLAFVQRAVMAQAAPDITAEMHLTKIQMGAILGSFSLAYALFEIPMGAYGDKFGPKRVLTQVVILWSVFTALTGSAWSYGSLWAARFMFGAGEAGCFPAVTKMLGAWLPRTERVRAQSLLWACARWGGASAGPLALLGITLFGWRAAFLVFAAFSLIWLIFFFIFHKDDPASHKKVNGAELELLAESRAMSTEHGKWGKLFVNPEMLVLALQYFCFASAWIFYTTWLQTYMIDTWHVTKQAAGL
ncbi:MAG: sauU, partial [Caulobacteraceae bacterium]|nr:sauU [Caulobacteraceae bacterium]